MENFRRSTAKTFLTSTPFTSGLICAKCREEGGRFNHFKHFENHKSYELC